MKKKIIALLLSVCMLASMAVVPAAAAGAKDVPEGHWAKDAVDRWVKDGIMEVDEDGNFRLAEKVTRAKFAIMLCKLMGYTDKADKSAFKDLPADSEAADALLKLAQAGVMAGDGQGNSMPDQPIDRQQMAVMLCAAFNLKTASSNATASYQDAGSVASWAQAAVSTLVDKKMMVGDGKNLMPDTKIANGDMAALLNAMIADFVTEDGATVNTGDKNGVVIINAKDVKVENAPDSAGIVVAPGAGSTTVTVTGTASDITVAAEGAKVTVGKDAEVGSVTVDAPKAAVTVNGTAGDVAVTEAAESAKVTVAKDATVTEVKVDAPKAETSIAGKVDSVAVGEKADSAKTTVAKGAEVGTVAVDAPKAAVSVSGTVASVAVAQGADNTTITTTTGAKINSVTTSADKVTVTGAANTVGSVVADAGSANVAVKGAEVKNDGADKVTVDGKKPVEQGKTETSTQPGNTGSTVGSSGGGGGTPSVTPDPTPSTDPNAPIFKAAKADESFAGKTMSALQTDVAVGTPSNGVYPVTGTLKYITGWTGFNPSRSEEQSGHYVAIAVPKTAGNKTVSALKIKGHAANGDVVDKEYNTGEQIAAIFTDDNNTACNIVFHLNEGTKLFSIWLKYGEATDYTEYKFSCAGATLEDNKLGAGTVIGARLNQAVDSVKNIKVIATAGTEVNGVISVTIATESSVKIPQHVNAESKQGYWVGFALVAPEHAAKVKYAFGTTKESVETLSETALEAGVDANGGTGIAFYANAGEQTPKLWASVQWIAETGYADSAVYTYKMTLGDIFDYGTPVPANLNGATAEKPEGENATKYEVVIEGKDITVTAEGLKKTQWGNPDSSGSSTTGGTTYVVGVGLPKVTAESVTYAWGFGETIGEYKAVTRSQTTGETEYLTFYFMQDNQDSWTTNQKGYISMKIGGNVVLTYTVNFAVTVSAEGTSVDA